MKSRMLHLFFQSSGSFYKKITLLFLAVVAMPAILLASHFRYGSISWTNTSGNTVAFKLSFAFRGDYYGFFPVDGQVINTGETFNFGDGTSSVILLTVTSTNSTENWFFAEYSVSHSYPSSGNYTAFNESCCRIGSLQNNANGGWRIATEVNVGAGNSSPVSSLVPIIDLPTGQSAVNFNIPAADANGNKLSFRFATSAEAGGAFGSFTQPAGLSINGNTGVMTFNTVGKSDGELYCTQIIISDGKALVPLDFFIRISNKGTNNAPQFTSPTPANGQVFNVVAGNNISFSVRATDADAAEDIVLSVAGAPLGSAFTPTLPATGNPVSSSFSWTPTTANLGTYVLNFNALDDRSASDNRSLTINVITADTFYSKPSGNLHNTATWGVNTNGTGIAPSNFGAGKTFMLANRGANYNLTANWTVGGNLHIPSGSSLNIGNYTLSLAKVSGPGSFGGTTTSKLSITGNSNTIRFAAAANNLGNLTITGMSTTATLANALNVYGVLSITNDGHLMPGNFLTLKSNATGTARVAQVTGMIGSGNVTVERYIPARRAWRLLNAPVSGSQTIKASWQEGASSVSSDPAPGYGTHITVGSTANGFDQNPDPMSRSNASLKMYNNASGAWVPVPNTNATTVGGKALMLFVRGNRAIPLAGPDVPANNTTLRAKGPLKTGMQMYPVSASGFTAVPNPYASPIDFQLLSKTTIQDNFYVWDPKLGGANGVGAFVNVSWNGSAYEMMPAPASPISKIIQSGQAFMVRSKGSAGSLEIEENDKSATAATNVFAVEGNSAAALNMNSASQLPQGLKVNLQIDESGSTSALLDGIYLSYNRSYSNEIDDMDVAKLANLEENLAIVRNGQSLLVDRRATAVANDTVSFKLWNTVAAKKYILEISPVNMASSGMYVYLKDHYLHTTTPVDLSAGNKVNFTVSDDPLSARADRFSMLISKSEVRTEGLVLNGISVFPNPVQDGVVRLRLLNQPRGVYHMQMVNSLGQILYRGQVNHGGGSAIQTIQLKNRLAHGIYLMHVTSGNAKTSLKIVSE